MNLNILFYTQISPFPTNGGERIRSYGLIKALSEIGYNVFAIINNEDNINLRDYDLPNVTYIGHSPSKISFFEKLFLLFLFKKERNVINIFNNILSKEKINYAFLDYAFIGQYIDFFKLKKIPVILGTHNAQADLVFQQPVYNIFQKIRKKQSIYFLKKHERKYFNKADKLIVVSEDDLSYHKKFVERYKISIIPNFLDESKYSDSQPFKKENYLIMTANFKAYMNFQGVKWFLETVWNNELAKKTELLLVGKGSKEALIKIGSFPSVKAIGMVDDITSYIRKSKAAIIPLIHGSGSRLKCLEAMALKVQIISTPKGVEGIKCDSFIIVNSIDEFKDCLLKVVDAPDVIDEIAYTTFMNNYSLKHAKLILEEIINSLPPPSKKGKD
ncbi:MAG: glycosyltransferase [Prevotella sp.]|jgi:hypothetical protein|nr:glycosyltransferase [Prevotella sp.]